MTASGAAAILSPTSEVFDGRIRAEIPLVHGGIMRAAQIAWREAGAGDRPALITLRNIFADRAVASGQPASLWRTALRTLS